MKRKRWTKERRMAAGQASLSEMRLPDLPLEEWEDTKETLHRYCQIVGKGRMELSPFRNHWWHVPLYVSPLGLAARHMFSGDLPFEITFDLVDHKLEVITGTGGRASFALEDGLSVADFYGKLHDAFDFLGIAVELNDPSPFELGDDRHFEEDSDHASYDVEYIDRYRRTLAWIDQIFREFSGRFNGKTGPVQLYWHSFDLAVSRFSGRRAPQGEVDPVTREAYSHEVISFGFWAGDENLREPAFYSYTAPEPEGLTGHPLSPPSASWLPKGGTALLTYEEVRNSASPRETLLGFMESAYEAGAKSAGWDIGALRTRPPAR